MIILTLHLLLGPVALWITARLYLVRRLPALGMRALLQPNVVLESLRHLWIMVLSRGAGFPGMSRGFVMPGVSGDLIAVLIAIVVFYALVKGVRLARTWV